MSRADERLAELGCKLPDPPTPVGDYTTAVESGGFLFLSGTTCYAEGRLLYRGRLGAELSLEQGYEAARQAALNLLSVLKAHVGDLDRVDRVVKVNGYVNSAPDFDQQPAVINGASDLLVSVFEERGVHARTSIGVSDLPGHIPVEIEMTVGLRLPSRPRAPGVSSSRGYRRT